MDGERVTGVGRRDIVLLSRADDVSAGLDLVGLLFECAPDSVAFNCGRKVIPLTELIGDFAETKCKAFTLARKLLDNEPSFCGVKQLGIFEEIVIRELQRAFHAMHLHRALLNLGIDSCRAAYATSTLDGLRAIHDLSLGPYRLHKTPLQGARAGQTARLVRVFNRLRGADFSAAALRAEWRQFLNTVDPFHRRTALSWHKPGQMRQGAIWFYSTAYTYTQIGLLYEPFFPERFTWLVENLHTGGRPLDEAGREYLDIYGIGKHTCLPSTKDIEQVREAVVRHLAVVELSSNDDLLARNLLLGSAFFKEFLAAHLPRGLHISALFASLLEASRPRAVVVGNPGFEGYLLQQAKTRNIPTILLQHGTLGDYCQFSDPPADSYIVRGSFWREFLAESPRRRAVVLNPSRTQAPDRNPAGGGRHILFLTTVYSVQEFFNVLDLDEILRAVLIAADAHGVTLVVRVHPLERIDYYRRKIEKLKSGVLAGVDVRFSQGAGLDDAVGNACVAVSFNSTVFLDCLRAGVPIVNFGWHDFSYKQQIADHGVFHFAQSLAHLGALIGEAVMGRLPAYAGRLELFLAESTEVELRKYFSRLVDVRQQVPGDGRWND